MPMPMAEMKFARVPLDQLHVSAQNVRKAAPDPDKLRELAASIAAEGLVEPLVVNAGKDGTAVIAGGRRLAAMQQLVADGKWEPHTPVPCVLISNGASPPTASRNREISLAENTAREDLHPVDQAEAFRALRDEEGATDQQLAARFRVSGRTVQRRLRMAQAAPELRQKCRDGEISLGVLEAVCIEPDHGRQVAAVAACKQARHNHAAPEVTRRLKKEAVRADSQLGAFVGLERYQSAGGSVSQDLFATAGAATEYLDDMPLVQRLMQERLKEEAEKEATVNGWPAKQIKREEAPWDYYYRWDESPATKLSSLPKRARGGAVLHLSMGHGGDVDRRVLVKRGTLSAEAPSSPIGEDAAAADQATKLPHSLVEELQAMRLSVLRSVLSEEAPAAFARDLLTFALARKVYGKARHPVLGLAVSATPHPNLLDTLGTRLPSCVTTSDEALSQREQGLLEWIGAESDGAAGQQLDLEWARFRALTGPQREQLLTCCVARMLGTSRPAESWADRAIHAEIPISWPARFDPEPAILSRLTKAQLLEIARRDFPAELLDLRGLASLKKAELVQCLADASAEYRAAKGESPWLPAEVFGD